MAPCAPCLPEGGGARPHPHHGWGLFLRGAPSAHGPPRQRRTVLPDPLRPVMSVTGESPKAMTWGSLGENDRTPVIMSFVMDDMVHFVSGKRVRVRSASRQPTRRSVLRAGEV